MATYGTGTYGSGAYGDPYEVKTVLRPDSTIGTSGWAVQGGGTAHAALNDSGGNVFPNAVVSGNYLQYTSLTGTVTEVGVDNLTVGPADTVKSIVLRFYILASNAGNSFKAEIVKGTTVIATQTFSGPLAQGWYSVTYNGTLTQSEVNDLRMRFTGLTTAALDSVNLHEAYLESVVTVVPVQSFARTGSDSTAVSDVAMVGIVSSNRAAADVVAKVVVEDFSSTPPDLVAGSSTSVTGGKIASDGTADGWWYFTGQRFRSTGDFKVTYDVVWDPNSTSRDIFNFAFWMNTPGDVTPTTSNVTGFMFRMETHSAGGFHTVSNGGAGGAVVPGTNAITRGALYAVTMTAVGNIVTVNVLEDGVQWLNLSIDMAVHGGGRPKSGFFGQKQDGAGSPAFPHRLDNFTYISGGVSDTATLPVMTLRTAADAFSLSDAASRASLAPSRSASESAALSDSAARAVLARSRTATESITLSDTATRTFSGVKSTADTFSVSDSALRAARSAVRASSDAVSAADSASRANLAALRAALDALTSTDAAVGGAGVVMRSAADSVSVSDSVVRGARVAVRSGSDTVSLSDGALRVTSRSRSASETALSVSDAGNRTVSIAKLAADAFSSSDTASRLSVRARSGAETLSISDSATSLAVLTYIRAASDAIALADAASRVSARLRTGSDAATILDQAIGTAVTGAIRTASDLISAADSASRLAQKARAASDSISNADVATQITVRNLTRSSSDTFAVSDASTRAAAARLRAAADALTASDAATRATNRLRAASDSFDRSDAASRATLNRTRAAVETTAVSDLAKALKSLNKLAADVLAISDDAVGLYVAGTPKIKLPSEIGVLVHATLVTVENIRTTLATLPEYERAVEVLERTATAAEALAHDTDAVTMTKTSATTESSV